MLSCYLKCRKNTEGKNPKVVKTEKSGRIMLLSKCAVYEKWIFIKEQEASRLLVE